MLYPKVPAGLGINPLYMYIQSDSIYCPFASKWRVVFVDQLYPNLRTEGNFQARFSRRKSIEFNKLYRLTSSFLRYVNISMCKFDGSVSCPGLYGGLYGQNLLYNFKNSEGDFRSRNFEKSHRTTGPWSDLRPDSWSLANFGLDSTFGNVETGSFWVTTRGALANRPYYTITHILYY
jgi:hypothetical protein